MLSRQCVSRPDGMGTLGTLAYIYSNAYALTRLIWRYVLSHPFFHRDISMEHLILCDATRSGRESTWMRKYRVFLYIILLSISHISPAFQFSIIASALT